MKITTPDYYDEFRCLCGDCPDTCCAGWEVVVDSQSLRRYRSLEGPLGDKIRSVLEETDGEYNFRLNGPRCPFLMDSGLCEMQAALGEDMLCRTCRLFPRILWESGDRREVCLSLSCPEAARLILTHKGPLSFLHRETDEPMTCFHDLDGEWYLFLQQMRAALLKIAQDPDLPLKTRMGLCVLLAADVQHTLRTGAAGEALPAPWQDPDKVHALLALAENPAAAPAQRVFQKLICTLQDMEKLTSRWDGMLRLMAQPPSGQWDAPDEEYERLFVYFLFRYFMDAAFDGNVYLPVKTALVCTQLIRRLYRCQPTPPALSERIDLAHLFSREIEHSADNIAGLQALLKKPWPGNKACLLALIADA